MSEYTHTLIATKVDFAPQPNQVGAFLTALGHLGAAPLKPQITVAKDTRKSDSVVNPFTGQAESYVVRKGVTVKSLDGIAKALSGSNDYNVLILGQGPPKTAPLKLQVRGAYEWALNLCLRAQIVSTSDLHDEAQFDREVPFFDNPCSVKNRSGVFCRPATLEIIEVPKAGCARFWIEFELGHSVYPAIKNSLDLLEPTIVRAAEKAFGLKFAQGCHWCA